MKLQDYRDDSYTFSAKASDINRQLGFAAIALIWLFKKDVGGIMIPQQLFLPSLLVVLSLSFDLFQYIAGWIIWHNFYRAKEKLGIGENEDLKHSSCLVAPITILFSAKIISMISAYVLISIYLARNIAWANFI